MPLFTRVHRGALYATGNCKKGGGTTRHTKYRLLLPILELRICPEHRPKIIIIDRLFIFAHEIAPALFACFALHLVFVDGRRDVEVWEVVLEVLEYFVVHPGETKLGARCTFQEGPVRCHLLDR